MRKNLQTTNSTSTVFISLLLMSLFIVPYAHSAEQLITTEDGREVLLKEDGQWQYRSTDRFATTKDGRRVRLKEDGRWSYAGNAPKKTKQQVRTNNVDIKLKKVVIEKYEKKVQKNTRVKTQTVFYLSLQLSAQAKSKITISDDLSLIEVTDNTGKSYPVLSIQPQNIIEPGANSALIIRADKSPRLFDDVKSMEITFNPGTFGLDKSISFSQRIIDFEKENVNGF